MSTIPVLRDSKGLQKLLNDVDAARDTAVSARDTAVSARDTAVSARDESQIQADRAILEADRAASEANDAEDAATNIGALGGIDGTVQSVGDLPSSSSSGDYYYVVDQAAYYKDTGNTTDGWEQTNIDLADLTAQNTFQKRQTLNEGLVVGSESDAPLIANERGAATGSATVKPTGGNLPGSVELFPSGTETRSHFIATNDPDYNNFSAVEFEVNGTEAFMKKINKGTPATEVQNFSLQKFNNVAIESGGLAIYPDGTPRKLPTNDLDVHARLVVGASYTDNNVRAPGNHILVEEGLGVAVKSPNAEIHVGNEGLGILQDQNATGDSANPAFTFQDGNGDRLGVFGATSTGNSRIGLVSDNDPFEVVVDLNRSLTVKKKVVVADPSASEPGTSTDPTIQMGTNGVGFFVNADSEIQAVPGSGSQMVLTSESYTTGTFTTDRSFDAGSTTVDELADVLATLLNDLNLR